MDKQSIRSNITKPPLGILLGMLLKTYRRSGVRINDVGICCFSLTNLGGNLFVIQATVLSIQYHLEGGIQKRCLHEVPRPTQIPPLGINILRRSGVRIEDVGSGAFC